MKRKIYYQKLCILVISDAIIITIAIYAAYLLRFDFDIPQKQIQLLKKALPINIILRIISFYIFDLYRGMWRFTSLTDLLNVIKATSLSSIVLITVILYSNRFESYSRSVFIIDWCFTILFVSGFRLSFRIYSAHINEGKIFDKYSSNF